MSSDRGLTIPESAWAAAWNMPAPFPAAHSVVSTYAKQCIVAAAPLVVAYELERLARVIDNAPYPYEILLARAAELRGVEEGQSR